MYTLLHKPLVPKLESMGFLVLNTYPFSQILMEKQGWNNLSPTWRLERDGHPNPYGHKILSDLLFEETLKNDFLKY